jgi:hypothetical protein
VGNACSTDRLRRSVSVELGPKRRQSTGRNQQFSSDLAIERSGEDSVVTEFIEVAAAAGSTRSGSNDRPGAVVILVPTRQYEFHSVEITTTRRESGITGDKRNSLRNAAGVEGEGSLVVPVLGECDEVFADERRQRETLRLGDVVDNLVRQRPQQTTASHMSDGEHHEADT